MTAYLTGGGWVVKVDGFTADVDHAIAEEMRLDRSWDEILDAFVEHDVDVTVLVRGVG